MNIQYACHMSTNLFITCLSLSYISKSWRISFSCCWPRGRECMSYICTVYCETYYQLPGGSGILSLAGNKISLNLRRRSETSGTPSSRRGLDICILIEGYSMTYHRSYSLCPIMIAPPRTLLRTYSGILPKRHGILVELNET